MEDAGDNDFLEDTEQQWLPHSLVARMLLVPNQHPLARWAEQPTWVR